MVLTRHQVEFNRLCDLRARAWLACNDFVEALVSQGELEEMDALYLKRVFYPSKPLRMAAQRLRHFYRATEHRHD